MHLLKTCALVAIALFAVSCDQRTDVAEPNPAMRKAVDSLRAIRPQPIPPGYDFPLDRRQLQQITDENDLYAMRAHAWNLWAGVNADSATRFNGKTLPIWETWLSTAEIFKNPPVEESSAQAQEYASPRREFIDPQQFFHAATNNTESAGTSDSAMVAFNKYNPNMVHFLWAGHSTSKLPKARFYYTSTSSLSALNDSWGSTPMIERKLVDAVNTAVMLKPVLMWVGAQGTTAIPFWQGPTASTDPNCAEMTSYRLRDSKNRDLSNNCHPDPSTWTHCVIIDPNAAISALRPATASEFAMADMREAPGCTELKNAQYGGVDSLYNFRLSKQEAAAFNATQKPEIEAGAGDFMVLLAMHVSTKELVSWTWQTFWWQGGLPTPDAFPGFGDDRPTNLPTPWNNYNMCSVYAQTIRADNTGAMNVCFNPYLETNIGIPDGLRSNCVSCHAAAAINAPASGGYPKNYSQPIDFNDPNYFENATRSDFSWSIPINAQPNN